MNPLSAWSPSAALSGVTMLYVTMIFFAIVHTSPFESAW
jgi:hypothetical protein